MGQFGGVKNCYHVWEWNITATFVPNTGNPELPRGTDTADCAHGDPPECAGHRGTWIDVHEYYSNYCICSEKAPSDIRPHDNGNAMDNCSFVDGRTVCYTSYGGRLHVLKCVECKSSSCKCEPSGKPDEMELTVHSGIESESLLDVMHLQHLIEPECPCGEDGMGDGGGQNFGV